MKRLSEAQRRVMTYLTQASGNYLIWREYVRGWVVLDAAGEPVMTVKASTRTVKALEGRGLLGNLQGGRRAASADAWALAHKGGLR